MISKAKSTESETPSPDRAIFRSIAREPVMLRLKNVDPEVEFRRFSPPMALIAPYLPPNPHRTRAFGGKGAEAMRKGFPSSRITKKKHTECVGMS